MACLEKVPPLGLEQSPSSSGNSNEPTATVANTLQLDQLKALLGSLDADIIKALFREIM